PGTLGVVQNGAAIGGPAATFTTFPFDGVIDEVAFYSTCLSAARVLTHYNVGINSTVNISVTVSETETIIATVDTIDPVILSATVSETETISVTFLQAPVVTPIPVYTLFVRDNATGLVVDVLDDPVRVQGALNFNGISQIVVTMDPNSIHMPSVAQDSDGNYLHGLIWTRDNQDGNGPIALFTGPISHFTADIDAEQA